MRNEAPDPFEISIKAWRELPELMQALPVAFIAVVLVMIPLEYLRILTGFDGFALPHPKEAAEISLFYTFAKCLLGTPFVIAIYRRILLGEQKRTWLTVAAMRRTLWFFICIFLAILAPEIWLPVAILARGGVLPGELYYWATIVGMNLGFVFYVTTLFLFPAIAVDSTGAKWRAAIHDAVVTWAVTGPALLLTILPGVLLDPLKAALIDPMASRTTRLGMAIVNSIETNLLAAAIAVMACYLYRFHADRSRGAAVGDAAQAG